MVLAMIVKYVDAISIKIFGIDSELPSSPKFAITKTGMPLHTYAPIH